MTENTEAVEDKDARISALEAALGEAGEALEPFIAWKDQMENHPQVLSTKSTFEDDDLPFTVTPEWRHLRKAKAVREKIRGVMQHSENAETKGSDASRLPNDQSDDGDAR